MNFLARILRTRRSWSAFILSAALLAATFAPPTARACWNTILAECFNQPIPDWPWGNWHVAPPSPRWGVHSGNYFDDTKRYVDGAATLSAADKQKIFEGNALKVYPRLKAQIEKQMRGNA